VITVGSSTVTADDSTKFSSGSQTLTAGGTITLKGDDGTSDTTICLPLSTTGVVVNGATEAFEAVVTNAPQTPLIIGSETLLFSHHLGRSGDRESDSNSRWCIYHRWRDTIPIAGRI
jgi:hypothetical protein